jgi:hypothetical protein
MACSGEIVGGYASFTRWFGRPRHCLLCLAITWALVPMLLPSLKLQLRATHDSNVQWKKPPKEDTYLYKGQHKGVSWPAGVWWENKRLAKWKVRRCWAAV